jgi:hypothetical protein
MLAVGAPAAVFLVVGAAWWLAPAFIAPKFGVTLQDGVGLSTQVGNLGAFFLTLGGCMATALVTGNRLWFRPALMLVGGTAFGRIIAWAVHGAAFASDMVAVEVLVAVLLVFSISADLKGSTSAEPPPKLV